MISLSLSIAQDGSSVASKSFSYNDADLARIVAAFQAEANVSVNGATTQEQVLAFVFGKMPAFIRDRVNEYEIQKAQADAVAAVQALEPRDA